MNENMLKKIKIINFTTFFFVWLFIFLAGADKPPPIGFLWIVLLVALLDVAQWFYLNKFIPKAIRKSKWLFVENLFYFFLGGMIVSFLTLIARLDVTMSNGLLNSIIWIMSIMTVALINAICFYVCNRILIRKFNGMGIKKEG